MFPIPTADLIMGATKDQNMDVLCMMDKYVCTDKKRGIWNVSLLHLRQLHIMAYADPSRPNSG
jgi:hypothetical protein